MECTINCSGCPECNTNALRLANQALATANWLMAEFRAETNQIRRQQLHRIAERAMLRLGRRTLALIKETKAAIEQGE